jgi:RNA polymerase sigma factor (sigma-70 family)
VTISHGVQLTRARIRQRSPRQIGSIGSPPAGNWQEVYATNVRPVYRFVYERTGNRPDAEDLTSQVFLQAFRHLRSGAPEEARAYLFATARALVANQWRERYRVVIETRDDVASAPAEVTGSDAAQRRIYDLLALLPVQYRRVLELRFLRGLSIREAAKEMRITADGTRVIQLRALRRAAELGA